MAVIERLSAEHAIERREISDDEILNRITCAWINEGAYILQEGIAQRSSDIDAVYVNGYGFPIYRGGPMHYADTVGVKKVYDMICEFQRQHGDVWKPSALLEQLAVENKTFSQWSDEQT
jgi:3-hydroxyacyl-CoA dehydrogenase